MAMTFTISIRPHWFAPHHPTPLTFYPNHIFIPNRPKFPLSSLRVDPATLPNAIVLTHRQNIVTISAHPDYPKDWRNLQARLSSLNRSDLEPVGILGRGASGTIYEAVCASGRVVAVKRVEKRQLKDYAKYEAAKRELDVLKKIPPQENIVKVHALRETAHAFLTIMEKINGRNLMDIVRVGKGVDCMTEVLKIIKGVLEAVKHLHENGIVHRDVKLENILVGDDGRVKLCDFGLAIEERKICGGTVGTGYARAPEIIAGKKYGREVDLWGCGVLLFIMVFKRVPNWKRGGAVGEWVDRNEWGGTCESVKNLLGGLLEIDKGKRVSADEVLGMDIFKDYEKGAGIGT